MNKAVRAEAATILLCAADWWNRAPITWWWGYLNVSDAVDDLFSVPDWEVRSAVGCVISALRDSSNLLRVDSDSWWSEAAALLLDGWEPGDEIVQRRRR